LTDRDGNGWNLRLSRKKPKKVKEGYVTRLEAGKGMIKIKIPPKTEHRYQKTREWKAEDHQSDSFSLGTIPA
jgi:hypothetical protein